MASPLQTSYIQDLAVIKTKEFKEVKELLLSSGIVSADSSIVADAGTLAEICNALSDLQASKFIDVLIAAKEPARGAQYSEKRITRATGELDHIVATINGWGFPE